MNSGPAALVGRCAAVVLALVVGGPATGGPVGVSTADAARCAASSVALSFPTRPDRDRALLPVGYRSLAPVTALWCRYDADGALCSAHDLDGALLLLAAGETGDVEFVPSDPGSYRLVAEFQGRTFWGQTVEVAP